MGVNVDTRARRPKPHKLKNTHVVTYVDGRLRRKLLSAERADELRASYAVVSVEREDERVPGPVPPIEPSPAESTEPATPDEPSEPETPAEPAGDGSGAEPEAEPETAAEPEEPAEEEQPSKPKRRAPARDKQRKAPATDK